MSRPRALLGAGALSLLTLACKSDPPAPPLSALSPRPLPSAVPAPSPVPGSPASGDARDAAFEVVPVHVFGDALPSNALRVELRGEEVRIDGAPIDLSGAADEVAERLRARFADRPALLVPDEDTFLLQAAPLLAGLDGAQVRTHLLHPEGKVSFRLTLSDERDFQVWLDQPRAGQVRVVHRADGFELQSNLGKLPGLDPNGPSVPLRGGQWDLARLRSGLQTLKERFDADTESCIVPSFGMELATVSRALTGYYRAPGSRLYSELCLVYPRPR